MLRIGGKQPATALAVMAEAAGRQHDAAPRPHRRFAVRTSEHGAADGAILVQQSDRGRRGPQVDAEVRGRTQKPGDQGETVAQLHAAPMQREIDQMAAEPGRDIKRRARRSGHVHEGGEIGTGLNGHAHEGGFARSAGEVGERGRRACARRRGRRSPSVLRFPPPARRHRCRGS